MTKLSCAVVRDLLPSFVDGLTSAETNLLVEEHVAGCAECRSALEAMRAETGEPQGLDAGDRQEIDFLRHNRRRNRRILVGSALAALLTIGLVLALRVFVVGSKAPAGSLATTVSIDGPSLVVDLVPLDSASAVADASFEELDGVVSVTTRSVLVSFLHPGSFQATYHSTKPVRQVRVNGQIVWADGSEVSALASAVFDTRHDYVGDMSANGGTLVALGAFNYLGAMQHELQTEEEPYGWTIYLQQDVVARHQALMESDMRSYAYVLLGVVGNLGEVRYCYTVDGVEQELAVTTEDASAFFGQDIKGCGSNVRLLDELLDRCGLTALSAG